MMSAHKESTGLQQTTTAAGVTPRGNNGRSDLAVPTLGPTTGTALTLLHGASKSELEQDPRSPSSKLDKPQQARAIATAAKPSPSMPPGTKGKNRRNRDVPPKKETATGSGGSLNRNSYKNVAPSTSNSNAATHPRDKKRRAQSSSSSSAPGPSGPNATRLSQPNSRKIPKQVPSAWASSSNRSGGAMMNASSLSHTIDPNPDHVLKLDQLVLPGEVLQKKGYVMMRLSKDDLERKKKCEGCGLSMSRFSRKSLSRSISKSVVENLQDAKEAPRSDVADEVDAKATKKETVLRCRFHTGRVEYKIWSCCGQHASAPPCSGQESHTARTYGKGELERTWQFYSTPLPKQSSEIRLAVAIDCEMGTAKSGDSELIRLTLVDYFTSAVLIDSLVFPDVPMLHYNTRFSGVTWKDMDTARRRHECIMGRDNAREAVWKFVGPNTIVIGHGGNNDLTSLRWIHTRVLDTQLVETVLRRDEEAEKAEKEKKKQTEEKKAAGEDVAIASTTTDSISETAQSQNEPDQAKGENGQQQAKKGGGSSLKALSFEKLGRKIQSSGKKGHDSLEDALATRDLAEWYVLNPKPIIPPPRQDETENLVTA